MPSFCVIQLCTDRPPKYSRAKGKPGQKNYYHNDTHMGQLGKLDKNDCK